MTYADVQSQIADILNRTDLTSQIVKFIQAAQRKSERSPRHRLRHMKVKTTLALVDGDYQKNNPVTNYLELINAHIIDSDGHHYPPLSRVPYDVAMGLYPDFDTKGRPLYICDVPADEATLSPDVAPTTQWLLRPTADASYTLDIQAYQQSPELDGATYTTNWWTQNAPEVLIYGALIEASPLLGDDDRIATWKGLYDWHMNDLVDSEKFEALSGSRMSVRRDPMFGDGGGGYDVNSDT